MAVFKDGGNLSLAQQRQLYLVKLLLLAQINNATLSISFIGLVADAFHVCYLLQLYIYLEKGFHYHDCENHTSKNAKEFLLLWCDSYLF